MLDLTTLSTLAADAGRAETDEEMIDALLDLDNLKSRVRDLADLVHEAAAEHIRAAGRDLVFVEEPGKVSPRDTRWYVGTRKEVREKNRTPEGRAALLEDVLGAVGGDVREAAELLGSSWLKQGAVRALSEPLWERHFERTEREIVKEGKPKAAERKLIAERVMFSGRTP